MRNPNFCNYKLENVILKNMIFVSISSDKFSLSFFFLST